MADVGIMVGEAGRRTLGPPCGLVLLADLRVF